MTKKALIFNPYLATLGGGEYYSSLVIDFLTKQQFKVEVAWNEENIIWQIANRFGINLSHKVKINQKVFNLLSQSRNLLKKYLLEKNYQLIFYVSDGSIPFLFGKKNLVLMQAPFHNINGRSLYNQLKLSKVNKVICYSNYVKKIIDKEYRINSQVIYPSINPIFFKLKPIQKENIILSVGRFDEKLNSKKQDILVKVFKKMADNGLSGWQLILIGGLLAQNNQYFLELQKGIKGYPIKILTNANFKMLINYYQKAKIYWHAAGFGEDLKLYPEKAEHFGISILEAIACQATPLVYNGGGVAEIINNPDFLWLTEEELLIKTKRLINKKKQKKALLENLLSSQAVFSQAKFEQQLEKLI